MFIYHKSIRKSAEKCGYCSKLQSEIVVSFNSTWIADRYDARESKFSQERKLHNGIRVREFTRSSNANCEYSKPYTVLPSISEPFPYYLETFFHVPPLLSQKIQSVRVLQMGQSDKKLGLWSAPWTHCTLQSQWARPSTTRMKHSSEKRWQLRFSTLGSPSGPPASSAPLVSDLHHKWKWWYLPNDYISNYCCGANKRWSCRVKLIGEWCTLLVKIAVQVAGEGVPGVLPSETQEHIISPKLGALGSGSGSHRCAKIKLLVRSRAEFHIYTWHVSLSLVLAVDF